MRRVGYVCVFTLLLGGSGAGLARQDPQAGRLVPSTLRAQAVAEFEAGWEAEHNWASPEAFRRANRALALDPSFGLARSLRAVALGGPTQADEMERGALDSAGEAGPEALLALAWRESAAGRTAVAGPMWQALTELLPNDPRIAFESAVALAAAAEPAALRALIVKFPDYAPLRTRLASLLTPFSYSPLGDRGEEALKLAQDAVRLAPTSPGSHAVLAQVLVRLGRYDEAVRHLDRVAGMSPTSPWAERIRAEMFLRQNRPADARRALDRAILQSTHIGRSFAYREIRSLTFLHEGNMPAAVEAFEDQARDAEAMNARGPARTAHSRVTAILAADQKLPEALEHADHARANGLSGANDAEIRVVAQGLAGVSGTVRRDLADYERLLATQNPTVRAENIHRLTGWALVAEKRYTEAIAEFQQAGVNQYALLGIAEAYRRSGNQRQADAELAKMLDGRPYPLNSTATPIARFFSMGRGGKR